ncbi:hypothetical protein K2F40_12840 [Clostridium sp. CM028]|uniref:hypothetical protein n=1 Tax=Clostridium TaxID=1485 RepID=UPI0013EE6E05|nr:MULTISPECIES: hypothetical protein [Clostridium]MBU3093549.1 hypothetical protein [Clostridium sp. CF011]MBW9145977.1 hypothetical protein [Clostridium sp. CM027]MBW9149844.1 hypothetical protein [Clostridium sp. CM028]MBZ9606759.1 hypothetical protein [Clostridium estertheticum]UVE39448.1 hypothetical protein KTC92_09295 [Clostridium sp. CM027]
MRNAKLERAIVRIDNEISAMNIAKKYLSNLDEIKNVQHTLNNKRQLLADELYVEDKKCYEKCCDVIDDMLDKELGKEDQIELLEMIRENFGRQSPNVSKKSSGLNAWLKELCIEYHWIKNEETDWDMVVITGFGLYE